jgi:hypothetical protein
MQGNLHVSFGEGPTEKGRSRDTSLAVYSTLRGGAVATWSLYPANICATSDSEP